MTSDVDLKRGFELGLREGEGGFCKTGFCDFTGEALLEVNLVRRLGERVLRTELGLLSF